MLEPGIEVAMASGAVPPEITAEYLMENRDPPAIIALIFLAVLTGIVVGTRCASRLLLVKNFGVDDALALLSLTLLIVFVVLSVILIQLGSGRHIEYIQYVLTEPETNWTETLDFIAHLFYTAALYVCRMSGLAFYHRLCMQHSTLSIAIKAGAVFLTAAFLPQIFLIIFHCKPVTSLWPYAWQPKAADYVCLMWGTVYSVNSGLSLVCDILLFTIPIFMIRSLKVSRKRKIHLSFVLLPGVFVIIISIVRLYLVVQGQWLVDGSWFYNPMLAIETAEIGATLIALSVPGLKPLLGKWFEVFNHSALPKSHTSGPGSLSLGTTPKKSHGGGTKLGSTDEDSRMRAGPRVSARNMNRGKSRGMDVVGPGESVDSLVDKKAGPDRIQVRTSLHVDSDGAAAHAGDIQLEMYPRNWEQRRA